MHSGFHMQCNHTNAIWASRQHLIHTFNKSTLCTSLPWIRDPSGFALGTPKSMWLPIADRLLPDPLLPGSLNPTSCSSKTPPIDLRLRPRHRNPSPTNLSLSPPLSFCALLLRPPRDPFGLDTRLVHPRYPAIYPRDTLGWFCLNKWI